MPDYHKLAAQYARQAGIPVGLFMAQIAQESGFRPDARSGSGAIGIAQIVPRWHPGVDPHNPDASLKYAANWMASLFKKYGNYRQALSVYNSGNPDAYTNPGFAGGQTYNYVRSIESKAGNYAAYAGTGAPPPPRATPATPTPTVPTVLPGASMVPGAFRTVTAPNPARASIMSLLKLSGIDPSMFPALPSATTSTQVQMPPTRVTSTYHQPPPEPEPSANNPTPYNPRSRTVPKVDLRMVRVAPGADRPGVTMKPAVAMFVSQVAKVWGHPLTITTGTNHNQYVAGENHVQSAHWTGYAADIAVNHNQPGQVDPNLTRLGQDALIAAGADPAWARLQHGGVYNIGGYNILFNTTVGGNHYNHLHVGIRGKHT